MISALSVIVTAAMLPVRAQDAEVQSEPELRELVQALRVPDVAWRQIPWKTCMLEGLLEARRTQRPLMLWCQIDRPTDDTRC